MTGAPDPPVPRSHQVFAGLDFTNDSNEHIGEVALYCWLQAEAENQGGDLEDVPDGIVEAWREKLLTMETGTTERDAASEAALRAAAQGNFALAGSRLRSVIINGAKAMADAPRAQAHRESFIQLQFLGAKTGRGNAKYGAEHARWIKIANEEGGKIESDRGMALRIVNRMAQERPARQEYKGGVDAPAYESVRALLKLLKKNSG